MKSKSGFQVVTDKNGNDWYVVHESDNHWRVEYIKYEMNSRGEITGEPLPVPADEDPDILPEELFEIE